MIRAIWFPSVLYFLSSIPVIFFDWRWMTVIFLIAMVVFLFDVAGRIKDFYYLKYQRNFNHLWKQRYKFFLKRQSSTRCSREVLIAVCPVAADDYRMLGYRWYHIFPDHAFTKDSPFLKISFWKSLFGLDDWQRRYG